ncbi:hypothetical protein ACJX0J_017422, partial [Zea mays]
MVVAVDLYLLPMSNRFLQQTLDKRCNLDLSMHWNQPYTRFVNGLFWKLLH